MPRAAAALQRALNRRRLRGALPCKLRAAGCTLMLSAMVPTDLDVLVVGAGPTGLTLACELARRGIAVRIIDKASRTFEGSRAKGLQPRTLEVFDDLGVVDQILAAGAEHPPMRIHLGPLSLRWHLLKHDARTPDIPYPNVWLIPQYRTEAILRARLSEFGIHVEADCELHDFVQDGEVVRASLLRNGAHEQVCARYLVGADGAHSTVRKRLGVMFRGAAIAGAPALCADVRAADLDREAWHVWPRGKWGPVALCPLPHSDRFQLFARMPAQQRAEPAPAAIGDMIRRALGAAAPALSDPSWSSLHRPSARLAQHYRVGRVLLAGDAAHVHPPMGGQGLNLGVQDAYNLGWKLAAVLVGASDRLLDSYEAERLPLAAATIELSKLLSRKFWKPRHHDTKQLRTHYRASVLSGSNSSGHLRAGDRAPDAPCLGPAGDPCRLFDLLRGTRPTLLVSGMRAARTAAGAIEPGTVNVLRVAPHVLKCENSVIDHAGWIKRSYELQDDSWVLIRPDGYIALLSSAISAPELRAALLRIGIVPRRAVVETAFGGDRDPPTPHEVSHVSNVDGNL